MLLLDEEEMENPDGNGEPIVEEFDFIGSNYNEEYVRVHNGQMNNFSSP